jgi:AmiR/NasT family two-component response regulator
MSTASSDSLATIVHDLADDGPIVHQASGILMARQRVTIEEAVSSLHEAAETRGVSVAEVAANIVGSTHRC